MLGYHPESDSPIVSRLSDEQKINTIQGPINLESEKMIQKGGGMQPKKKRQDLNL